MSLCLQVLKGISTVKKHNILGLLVAGTKGGEASLWRGNNVDSVPYFTALSSNNVCQPRCSGMMDFLCFLIPRRSQGWSNLLTLSKVLLLGQICGNTDQLSCTSLQISPDSSSTWTTPKLAWMHKVASLQRMLFSDVSYDSKSCWAGEKKESTGYYPSVFIHCVRTGLWRVSCFSIPVNWHSAQADKNSKSPWPSDSRNQSVCSHASSLPSYYDNCILSQPLPYSSMQKPHLWNTHNALLPLLQYIIICFHRYTKIGIVLRDFCNSKVCARNINWPNYPNKNVTECKHGGVTNIHARWYKEIRPFSWLQRLSKQSQ